MNINEFAEIIKERLEERTGLEVRLAEVIKNNSVTLHGISIIVPEINIAPNIYLESFFKEYERGMSFEEITERIINVWEREKGHKYFDVEWFRDFEQIKERIAYKLVNYEANRKLLEDVPHVPFLNLAKVFYVTIDCKEFGSGSILVHNNHMELWGVTTEELDEIASINTPKLFQAEIMSMAVVMKELMQDVSEEMELLIDNKMFVVTNKDRHYGAAAMCYPNIIKKFAEQKECDLIILPSSVHEVLILPCEGEDFKRFKEMVIEVNETALSPEEVLSNSVYIYRRELDKIVIA